MKPKKQSSKQKKGMEAPEKKHGAVINKQIALVLYIALGVVAAALLLMTVLASAGVSGVWNGMPVVVVLAVLGIALAVSVVAFNPRKNFYSIGFYVLHIGIVLFLIGSLVYAVSGQVTNAAAPNVGSFTPAIEYQMKQKGFTDDQLQNLKGYYNQVGKNDGSGDKIELGFNFRVADFKTELYDNGAPKHYDATIEFLNEDGTVDTVSLTVNHPIYRNGWKIYLMDVGTSVFGYQEIQLMFKKDSTEFLSNAGIVLTIVGAFMMCFIRPRDKAFSEEEKAKKADKKKQRKAGEAA